MSNTKTLRQCSRKDKCFGAVNGWMPETDYYFVRSKGGEWDSWCKACHEHYDHVVVEPGSIDMTPTTIEGVDHLTASQVSVLTGLSRYSIRRALLTPEGRELLQPRKHMAKHYFPSVNMGRFLRSGLFDVLMAKQTERGDKLTTAFYLPTEDGETTSEPASSGSYLWTVLALTISELLRSGIPTDLVRNQVEYDIENALRGRNPAQGDPSG